MKCHKCHTILCLSIVLGTVPLCAQEPTTMLFSFEAPDASEQWQTVNDGVMGGLSEGRFKIGEERTLQFFGKLSLENNGGFASVRSRPRPLNLKTGDTLVTRVRGDGRQYSLNLYIPTQQMAFAYRAFFDTQKDEWIEVSLPLDQFQATSFGNVVDRALDPQQVHAIGFLLGDKQPGPFRLEVDWAKVARPQ